MSEQESEQDKMQWLRQRGVEIELASDREANQADPNPDRGFGSFSYLRLPADTSLPPELLSAHRDNADVLPRLLKRAFTHGAVNKSVLEAQIGRAGADLSTAAVERTLAEGCVETFALARASEANKYCAVNLYLDEVGTLKMLPINSRASQLARRCGFEPPPALHGDVFLARVAHQPLVANADMTLEDLKSDADWLQSAAQDNLEAQARSMEAGILPDDGPTAPDGEQQEEGYKWSQTEEDLEVLVQVPRGTKSKLIQVVFKARSVTVKLSGEVHLELAGLVGAIDTDCCAWTLDVAEGLLCITLEKNDHINWPSLLE
eukprot:TRINITY_DN19939_c0_g1_i5.p1 TRINITY_DN19939_c0_g1~~TRINITY_DN19939_c0_g1_i5.p1  ORF type:complete len:318 (+),score=74.03 TRINITY_DN19939_c0_g1_i5:175-1128(+)